MRSDRRRKQATNPLPIPRRFPIQLRRLIAFEFRSVLLAANLVPFPLAVPVPLVVGSSALPVRACRVAGR